MEIGGFLGVITNDQVIELCAGRMLKSRGHYELGRAAPQIFKIDSLGLCKRKPVRQLEETGGVLVLFQQILYTHEQLQRYSLLFTIVIRAVVQAINLCCS